MKLLTSLLFLGLVANAEAGTCSDCRTTYTTVSDAGGATNTDKCNALKTYLTCLEGATGAGCPLSSAHAQEVGDDSTASSCSFDPLCGCQEDYWGTDIGGSPADCNAAKARVTCLRGTTGTACDGSSVINDLGTNTDDVLTAIAGTCSPNAACTCERTYVKTDVSDNAKMCTASLVFLGCVKGIDGTLCDGTDTVQSGASAADTVQSGLSSPACTPTDGCACEVTYATADVSDDTKKCAQAGTFVSCLKTKTGVGCDGSTSVAAMAGTADTAMTSSITGCTQTDGCVCEAAYAAADISDDTKKCAQAGTFVSCLKTKTGVGCDGSTTVAAMAGTADTAMTSSITGCTQTDGCVCEAAYASADISDDTKKCAQAGTFVSCLKTKTGVGCDGSTTVAAMAGTADTAMTSSITGCTQTDGCVCEAAYAAADISDDTKKCAQAGTFVSCLKTKTGVGCDGTTTVAAMAGTADTAMTSSITGCTQTDGCVCEAAYASADISDDTKKCAQAGTFVSCLKTKTGVGCDGSTTVAAMAGTADTAMTSSITGCTQTDGCVCEAAYAAADISDDTKKCAQAGTFVSCLKTKTGVGCDGTTTVAAMAGTADTAMTSSITGCTQTDGCVCEAAYAAADISDDTKKCAQAGTFISCLKSKTGAGCDGSTTVAAMAGTANTAMTSGITGCSQTDGCACEAAYAAADISDDTKKCTQAGTFVSCLKTKTGVGCDGSTTVAAMAGTADTAMTSSITGCTQTDGCVCEAAYAKADISDDTKKCAEAGTFISCLKTKTGAGCDGSTTVAAMAGTADTAMSSITGCSQTDGCACEAAYAAADISDDTKKCTQAGTFVSCLKTKTGVGCDGSTTVAAMAGTADTAMTSGITGCAQTDTCACEAAYAKADISDDTKKCAQAGTFISCLKTKTGAGCDGTTTVTTMAGTADTAMTASITGCSQSAGCTCESTYAQADISDDTKKCTEGKKFIGCLKSETGMGCDGSTTVAALATAANTYIGAVTGCTKSAACECEVTYASADISDDTKHCTEVKKYISCLKAQTGTGCDGTRTVVQLATAAESTASGITGCTLTGTACKCEADYAKADISDDTKLCTETKTFVDCLKDKADTCADTKSTVVTAAETTMSGIAGSACDITSTVCQCDAEYAKLDVSTDPFKCIASKNYISCLLGKTGMGCDGSTALISSATTAEAAITAIGSSCTKTSVCDCEITYAKADISSDATKCAATKELTTCTMLSIDNGCGADTTKTSVGTVASAAFTALASACTTTATCDCQATFNAADISANIKCTSGMGLITCLDAISSTTETACDGTLLTTELKTNATTSIQKALCSFGTRVEVSSFVAVFMMTISVLVISL